jgi:RNA polymerase sigma factor (sigma-70 family)
LTGKEYNEAVHAYSGRLYGYVLKFLRDPDDSNDIVQDAYMKLWQHKKDVPLENSKAWLFTTAYRGLVNLAKRNGRTRSIEESDYLEQSTETNYELKELIDRSMAKLPDLQKSIILLRDLEGYNYKEIGDILNLSESQVKVYLFRGRKKMKDLLKDLTVLA